MSANPAPSQQELLDAALAYGKAGYAIFPLYTIVGGKCDCNQPPEKCTPGKHPRTLNGLNDATTDEMTIRRWWKQWPNANIGWAVPEGYVVVDVDGDDGAAWVKAQGGMTATAVQKTSRGHHYVYRTLEKFRNVQSLAPHVDIRGKGGYIVVAPSIHESGHVYHWLVPMDLGCANAPDWMVKAYRERKGSVLDGKALGLAQLLAGVPIGRRDVELFRAACKMRALDTPIDLALELITRAADACDPPFEVDVAHRKVWDAYNRYPANVPKEAVPERVTLLGKREVMVDFKDQVTFVFSDINTQGGQFACVAEVVSKLPGQPYEPFVTTVNLASGSAFTDWRRMLQNIFGKEITWDAVAAKAKMAAGQAISTIDLSKRASEMRDQKELRYIVQGLVPESRQTIFFGTGASLKTMISMDLAICISLGLDWMGRPTIKMPALWVDHETGEATWAFRLKRLLAARGLTLDDVPDLHYWWAEGTALSDQVTGLKACIDKHGIGVVFVDHIGSACGGDATEQSVASKYAMACSRLEPATVISLAHVNAENADKPENAKRPYGNIYWENAAGRTYFILRYQEAESSYADVGIYPRKCNDGARPAAFGATVRFEDPAGPIYIHQGNGQLSGTLARARGPEHALLDALEGGPLTVKEISDRVKMTERQVESILDGHARLFVQTREGGKGKGNAAQYGRADQYVGQGQDDPAADYGF